MSDSAETLHQIIFRHVHNALWSFLSSERIEKDLWLATEAAANEIAALGASGTKSDGLCNCSWGCVEADNCRRKVAPGPSDPIAPQPDERERIQQIIELAMIEDAEIQYADFADRDRQREKIITSAAAAILVMQAERRAQPAPIAGLEPVAWQGLDADGMWVDCSYDGAEIIGEYQSLREVFTRAQLEAYAAEQVRACASIADSLANAWGDMGTAEYNADKQQAAQQVADAIRARGQV